MSGQVEALSEARRTSSPVSWAIVSRSSLGRRVVVSLLFMVKVKERKVLDFDQTQIGGKD